jgi:predicted RNA-binding Zn-ribbon protein involved in translation (DUF1610 family)
MFGRRGKISRYDVACPVCGVKFRPNFSTRLTTFDCPNCGEALKFVPRRYEVVLFASMAAGFFLAYKTGYSGFSFMVVAFSAVALIWFAAVGLLYHLNPPKVQTNREWLRLTDNSRQ